MDFVTSGRVVRGYGLWTSILARSNDLKLKQRNDEFVFYKCTAFHFIIH